VVTPPTTVELDVSYPCIYERLQWALEKRSFVAKIREVKRWCDQGTAQILPPEEGAKGNPCNVLSQSTGLILKAKSFISLLNLFRIPSLTVFVLCSRASHTFADLSLNSAESYINEGMLSGLSELSFIFESPSDSEFEGFLGNLFVKLRPKI
jgi:hypothetical protein